MASPRRTLALRTGVSLALLAVLAWVIDPMSAWTQLRDLSLWAAAAALLMMWIQLPFSALRWWLLTRASPLVLGYWEAIRLQAIAVLFAQVLPSTLGGDAVRIAVMAREGHSTAVALHTVAMDRIFAVTGLLTLTALTQPFLPEPILGWRGAALLAALGLGVLIAGLVAARLTGHAQGWLRLLLESTAGLVERPIWPLSALAVAIFNFTWLSAILWVLAHGMGSEVTLLQILAVAPPVWLATALPLSIGGWGVREGAMVAAFAWIGAPAEEAVAASVAMGLVTAAGGIPGALLWPAMRPPAG